MLCGLVTASRLTGLALLSGSAAYVSTFLLTPPAIPTLSGAPVALKQVPVIGRAPVDKDGQAVTETGA